jgi:dTDP-4-amino-4,6-dideoxygalactose transaminase
MSIPFTKPYFSAEARREILMAMDNILSSGRLMLGEYTDKLESGFATYIATANAVTTNTCTTALQICMMHYDVRGYEVLVPSAGFITDVSVVKWAGGTPVLVDTDPATLSFDLDDLKRKLTPRTKGIIWVHLTGLISPAWREIVAFAREHGLFLIEDCAHAHGASVNGNKAGALGDVGCFSFYPTKVMTTGTGGILTTNDPALAASAREIRNFGRKGGVGNVVREGNDWFLDEIRACLGYFQLRDLDSGLARRREIADLYGRRLSGLPGLRFLKIPKDHLPAWYHYTVFVHASIDYERLANALKEKHGIPTKPIYLPLHQELIFRDLDDGSLRQTEKALNRSLCLPLYVEMQDAQVECVVAALTSELGELQCPAEY